MVLLSMPYALLRSHVQLVHMQRLAHSGDASVQHGAVMWM